MIDQFTKVIKEHYADFDGRARRKEYWGFAIVQAGISIVLQILAGVLGDTIGSIILGLLGLIGLALFIPGLALSVRRMHDVGKSGWFILIGLVPIVGIFILIYFLGIKDSDPGVNEYGPNPKDPNSGINNLDNNATEFKPTI